MPPDEACPGGQRYVSILVFVELALDVCGDCPEEMKKLPEFQSLFSWNLLLMFGCRVPEVVTLLGFNPCFRGTCS